MNRHTGFFGVAVLLGGLSASAFASDVTKIVGGQPAAKGEYPFYAALVLADGSHLCGAALIAPRWVLTAEHCIRGHSPHSVSIGLEQYRPELIEKDRVEIEATFGHPDYDSQGQFDIALVKLKRPANSTSFLKLDGMESHMEPGAGYPVTLIGFGRTETGYGPDVLYEGQGQTLEVQLCIDAPPGFPSTNFNPENNICAGYNQAPGDSGGPLLYKSGTEYLEIGLVSRSLWLNAGQYTRVGYFADWIKQTLQENP
ncbi:serine protease [Xanthomonas sp. WHRI 1810A]|uniref:S1 family peptidase n=1 Tax=Xanthomonas sp. WHRI 1810A TaxID=3161565 RepID=UPI0032E9213A